MLLAVGLFISSCADEDLAPVLTFDTAGKGAVIKLVDETARELDLASLSTAAYTYSVEFNDLDQGTLVSAYDITVSFIDNNPSNGDKSADFKDLRSFSASEFVDTPGGLKGVNDITITLSELLSLFSLAEADLLANDRFRIEGFVTLQDGSRFGSSNSTSAVRGSAFQGHFGFNLTATCPLPDALFSGTYALSYDGDATGGFGLPFAEGDLTLSVSTSTKRSFTAPYLPGAGPFGIGAVTMEFVCDQVLMEKKDSGVTCGSGGITFGSNGLTSPANITDDSQFSINIVEYIEDGGCGVSPIEKTLVFTKK